MTIFSISLLVVCILLGIVLGISLYFNFKHGVVILNMQDAIERSLDTLDIKYKRISEILETPVFFDSVEVRQVLSEIKDARRSVLYVAGELSNIDYDDEAEEGKNG
jgi:hypothetical protein